MCLGEGVRGIKEDILLLHAPDAPGEKEERSGGTSNLKIKKHPYLLHTLSL